MSWRATKLVLGTTAAGRITPVAIHRGSNILGRFRMQNKTILFKGLPPDNDAFFPLGVLWAKVRINGANAATNTTQKPVTH